jgi:hypothetical protein
VFEAQPRAGIMLVEPKLQSKSFSEYNHPKSITEFLDTDQFGKYWRDFRAKNPGMLAWIHKPETISSLLQYLVMDPIVAPTTVVETPDPYVEHRSCALFDWLANAHLTGAHLCQCR